MDLILNHLLSIIVFSPLLGVLGLLLIPKSYQSVQKWFALIISFIPLVLSIVLFQSFDRGTSDIQFREIFSWIPSFNVEYFLGIDGLSLPMVLLTSILCVLCIIASWKIETGLKGYLSLFLLLETGMLGVFVAL